MEIMSVALPGLFRRPLAALTPLLLLTLAGAQAQGIGGKWGAAAYEVELTVNGSQVAGTFKTLSAPQNGPGQIAGQLRPDGQSFTAQWTFSAGGEAATFSTLLTLTAKGRVLSGYRWSEESPPAAFALHRATDGQVPVLPDQDTVGNLSPPPVAKPPTPAPSTPVKPPATPTPATRPGLEVIICESAPDGNPQNVGTDFTAPKSILALVRHTDLPDNSTLSWVWTRDGKPEASRTELRRGTGWYYHGLQSQTALPPGQYQVTVTLNGNVIAQRAITVRGTPPAAAPQPAAAPPPAPVSRPPVATPAPTPSAPTSPAPLPPATAPVAINVALCTSIVNGQPQGIGTVFTRPRQLLCLLRYENLPAQSQLKWVWTRGGKEVGRHLVYVSGTGYSWHGLSAPKGLTPGLYEVAVYARGQAGPRLRATVR